jgi:3-dehydroquinate synthase
MTSINVPLGEQSYDVLVKAGALKRVGELLRKSLGDSTGRRILLVADAAIAETHAERVAASLEEAGFAVSFASIEAVESNKTIEVLEALLETAAREHIDRSGAVVAVGGGIVGDLGGFLAASWLRGIPVLQVPTTLLAMVDASIGGKTGVNLPLPDGALGKNLVGAFWQPVAVVADPKTLVSLPRRERACGFAECIKHGVIADWPLLEELRTRAPEVLDGDIKACGSLVARCAAIKVNVVGVDVREETGPGGGVARAFLNLGHTFAHAIEPMPELKLKHGEAVAIGLVAAGACARQLGHWSQAESDELIETLEACALPTRLPQPVDAGRLLEHMGWDKKVRQGTLSIIVPTGRGRVEMLSGPDEALLLAGWQAVGASVR